MVVLNAGNIVLRPLRPNDAKALYAVFSDPQVCQYWSSAAHTDRAQTREYVSNSALDEQSECWAITLGDDLAIGWVVLIDRQSQIAEIGFILTRSHWNKGLVSKAVAAVIEFGFLTRKLRRIYADIDPDNIGSVRVMEKLGFQFEGHARATWETHLGVRDSLIYARINTD